MGRLGMAAASSLAKRAKGRPDPGEVGLVACGSCAVQSVRWVLRYPEQPTVAVELEQAHLRLSHVLLEAKANAGGGPHVTISCQVTAPYPTTAVFEGAAAPRTFDLCTLSPGSPQAPLRLAVGTLHTDRGALLRLSCRPADGKGASEGGGFEVSLLGESVGDLRLQPAARQEPAAAADAAADVGREEARRPLDRYANAEWHTRPAWMTKGVGVGTEYFGETKGDLMKPGMTRAQLEEIEKRTLDESTPDPFRDVFSEVQRGAASASAGAPDRRRPLPAQGQIFGEGTGLQSGGPKRRRRC